MADIKAKKVIFKNRDGEYLIPYVGDSVIDHRITNCLLEIPQNIKLELNDGVLTLKAGSKVIVPNGFEVDGTTPKFDEVIVATNRTLTPTVNKNGTIMMYLNGSNQSTDYMEMGSNFSSATQPNIDSRMYAKWYDTTENKLKWTKDGGATWNGGYSFPICIFKTSDTANADGRYNITSIEQVFNGFGYIGSTIWVDKGVKGLIPNGRNEDGSLRNIDFETPRVFVSTKTGTNRDFVGLVRNSAASYSVYRGDSANYKYDEEKNINIDIANNTQWNILPIGYTTGDITSFQSKQPFRAINYSDKAFIAKWGMPSRKYVDLTLGASNTQYKAPANGYFFLSKTAKASGQYAYFQNYSASNLSVEYTTSSSTGTAKIYIPAKKGDLVMLEYNLTGATNYFRFIYAEGEV